MGDNSLLGSKLRGSFLYWTRYCQTGERPSTDAVRTHKAKYKTPEEPRCMRGIAVRQCSYASFSLVVVWDRRTYSIVEE